jgi:prolyl oligopeptidase
MLMRLTNSGRFAAATTFVVSLMAVCSSLSEPTKPALTYPATTTGGIVDDYHGTKADPYRWMESLDSPEVASWIQAQNAVTDPYLAALPRRAALNERLTAL